jgi:serine phosphatase RsbU (regulator of sigma subunit)
MRDWELEEAVRQRDPKFALATSFCGAKLTAWSAPANDQLVGGDWCEAFALSDHLLALSIGDVCGHGIDASNQMIAIREVLEAAAHELRDPAKILARANTLAYELVEVVPVTGIVALFDALANTLTFANAGHPPPLMVGPCGQLFLARYPADIPLGITPDHSATSYVIPVPPDTLLVFYTDGVTEHQRDPITGEEQLRLAAAHTYRYPQGNTAQTIAHRVLSSASSPDDAAILTLQIPARLVTQHTTAHLSSSRHFY